jgi:hypothetical protein
LISADIGLGTLAIADLIVLRVRGQKREGYFEYREYWINDDGIMTVGASVAQSRKNF